MGFTTGFVGGITLTYTLTYLSLYVHRQHRTYQASLLSQQKALLTSLYEPPTEVYEQPAYEIRPAGLTEQLKDRWNRELETAIRTLQEKDWEETRIRWEERLGNVWGRVKESEAGEQAKAAGEQVAAGLSDARGRAEEAVKDAQVKAREIAKDTQAKAQEIAKDAQVKAREIAKDTQAKAQEIAKDAQDKARELAKDTSKKAQEVAREVKHKAVEAKDAIVDKAQDLKQDAKDLKREATVATKEVTGQKRLLEL